jgi:hypothetical protein
MAQKGIKKASFTIQQKREIWEYANCQNRSQQEIAYYFSTKWGIDIKRRTIGDIISQKAKWMDINPQGNQSYKRMRTCQNEQMEKALFLW